MLDAKAQFFFYLGAVVCFVLAVGRGLERRAHDTAWARATTRASSIGLALYAFPLMWNTGYSVLVGAQGEEAGARIRGLCRRKCANTPEEEQSLAYRPTARSSCALVILERPLMPFSRASL